MNKAAILKAFGGSEEDFYKMYPTEDHFKKAMGGAFEAYTGPVPDFFNPQFIMDEGGNVASPMNYGAFPAMGFGGDIPCFDCGGPHMQIGGPIPQQYQNLDNEGRSIPGGLMWDPATGRTLKDPINQPLAPLQINGVQAPGLNPDTQSSVGINFNTADSGNSRRSFGILGAKPGQMLDTNTNRLKKEGGSADQGLNQDDVLKQQKDTFLGFIQGNTQKALMKEIHEELMGEMMRYGGIPKAQYGYQANQDADYQEYLRQKYSKQIPYTQNYNPNSGYTGMNYFPMNRSQTWKPGKKDLETMNSLSKDAKYTGFKANYGVLGRLAPRMFGPKSYEFNFSDVNPVVSQGPGVNLVDKNNPLYDPNKDVSTPAQAGSLYQSSKPDGRNFINHAINPYDVMAYGGVPMAQDGRTVLGKPSSPYLALPTMEFSGDSATQSSQTFPTTTTVPEHPLADTLNNIEMKDYAQDPADRINKSVKVKAKNNYNGEELANWLLAGSSGVSSMLEGRDRQVAEERMEMLQAGDNQFFATQGNRGDYDVNSGMFRVDQDVPVQFSGAGLRGNNGQAAYMQEGGVPKKWFDTNMEASNSEILSHVRNRLAAGEQGRGVLKHTPSILDTQREYENMTKADRERVDKLLKSPEGLQIIQDDSYMRNHNFSPFNPFNVSQINRQQKEKDKTYQFGGENEEELELTDEEIAAIEAAGGQVEYLD